MFKHQEMPMELKAVVGSDFAGGNKGRQSTSGGLLRMGAHVVKTWVTTQSVIALHSGEADYYAMVKGVSQGLGMKSLLADMGIKVSLGADTYSSAAMGYHSKTRPRQNTTHRCVLPLAAGESGVRGRDSEEDTRVDKPRRPHDESTGRSKDEGTDGDDGVEREGGET